jgi:hypothetical protein
MNDAVVAFEDAFEEDRKSKYFLRERRRSSTSSGASASTNILGCGMGDSSNESHQAMGRRTSGARRAGSLSPGRGEAVQDRSAKKAGKGENRFETTPGHFAFATPMTSARTTPLAKTTPRTPCFASSPPDEARLENLLAAPVKPNGGRRAATSSANECTPNATPLKLRFDNLDVVISSAGTKSNKKRARRVSDHFPSKKSTTPTQRFTRARKCL